MVGAIMDHRHLRELIPILPPAQRMATVLRYFEGLDCRSVASAMDTTVKSVERLLARGREAMEPLLARLLDE